MSIGIHNFDLCFLLDCFFGASKCHRRQKASHNGKDVGGGKVPPPCLMRSGGERFSRKPKGSSTVSDEIGWGKAFKKAGSSFISLHSGVEFFMHGNFFLIKLNF